MGYISVKITDIEIPNSFRVFIKPDAGESKPYPIDTATGGWTSYGSVYSGGTTEIWLSGSTYDFQYGTTYWIKLEEASYSDRYVVKNIRIFDAAAYQGAGPAPSVTASISVSPSVTPSITRTSTPSRTPDASFVPVTPTQTMTQTPSLSVSSSVGASQSPSPTQTPSITPTNAISEVRFTSLTGETGIMGISNAVGKTYSITFDYTLNAIAENGWSMGGDSVQATTYFFVSVNGGSTWTEVAYVTAEVSGGNYPVEQSDSQSLIGTITLTGITSTSQVRVLGQYDCDWMQNYRWGNVEVTITNVTITAGGGSAVIVCNDIYRATCPNAAVLECTYVPVSSPPSSQTPTPTPTPSPALREVVVWNNVANSINITNVWIGGSPVYNESPAFPLYPGDNNLSRSPRGDGIWDVIVFLTNASYGYNKMMLTGSTGYVHCENVAPGQTQVNFFGITINGTGWPEPYGVYGNVAISIELFNGGSCPPPPSQSNTQTPSITPSMSLSATPGLSPSRTPTSTPIAFGYNINIYSCNGTTCGNYISNAWIENPYPLTVDRYYVTDYDVIYYITSVAPLGGDNTVVVGTGYASCNDACAAAPF